MPVPALAQNLVSARQPSTYVVTWIGSHKINPGGMLLVHNLQENKRTIVYTGSYVALQWLVPTNSRLEAVIVSALQQVAYPSEILLFIKFVY